METKGAVKSVTLGGILICILSPAIELASSGALGPKGVLIGSILGGAIAAYGRYKANTKIKGLI